MESMVTRRMFQKDNLGIEIYAFCGERLKAGSLGIYVIKCQCDGRDAFFRLHAWAMNLTAASQALVMFLYHIYFIVIACNVDLYKWYPIGIPMVGIIVSSLLNVLTLPKLERDFV